MESFVEALVLSTSLSSTRPSRRVRSRSLTYFVYTACNYTGKRQLDIPNPNTMTSDQVVHIDPAECRSHGLLDFSRIRGPCISPTVHQIWHYDNWRSQHTDRRTPRALYEKLKPALALATKFITHDSLVPWWCTLANGKVITSRSKGIPNGFVALGPVQPTPQNMRSTQQILIEHAQRVTFEWMELRTPNIMGNTRANGSKGNSQIRFPSWLRTLLMSNTYDQWDLAKQTRLQFYMATNLAHELAHSLWIWRSGDRFNESMHDPIHTSTDVEAELGHSMMFYVLGGCLWSMPYNQDLDWGLSITSWQTHGDTRKRIVAQDPTWMRTGIPMDILWCFFNEEFWQWGAKRSDLMDYWQNTGMGQPIVDPKTEFPARSNRQHSWGQPPHLLCWLLPRACPTCDV